MIDPPKYSNLFIYKTSEIYSFFLKDSMHSMHSSLTLVLAFCKRSNDFQNKFYSFLTFYIVPHTPKASQWCARPVFASWDWDWDSVYPVYIFDTDTETFKIGIQFWDWDFINWSQTETFVWYQKLRLRRSSVSNIKTDTETFN